MAQLSVCLSEKNNNPNDHYQVQKKTKKHNLVRNVRSKTDCIQENEKPCSKTNPKQTNPSTLIPC